MGQLISDLDAQFVGPEMGGYVPRTRRPRTRSQSAA